MLNNMMKEAQKFIGRKAYLEVKRYKDGSTGEIKKLHFEVKIKDYKDKFGHQRMLVEPKAGKGELWVNEENLSFA